MNEPEDSALLKLSPWSIVFEGDLPDHEGAREALCTLGNGRFGTRGASSQTLRASGFHYPGTYAAAVYDRLCSAVPGGLLEYEELVNLPNWLGVRLSAVGAVSASDCEWQVLEYRRELDMARGLLHWHIRLRDPGKRQLRITEQRLVHMGQAHLAAQKLEIEAEGFDTPLSIGLSLDATIENKNAWAYAGLDGRHLEACATGSDRREQSCLYARTRQSHIGIALCARQRAYVTRPGVDSVRVLPARALHLPARVDMEFLCAVPPNARVSVEKLVTLYTSRDRACLEPREEAARALASAPGFDALAHTHTRVWQRLWQGCAFELPGREHTLAALRLHMFHILQTVSPYGEALDAGAPARGLHGENYRGHIFWDELFVFPFLSLRWPELTRRLLLYRYRRLEAARRAAGLLGLRGAMFPWRSASDGREVTEPLRRNPRSGRFILDHTHLQRHINAAIVYNVWQYVRVSGDLEFLFSQGAELILSVALFWASAARLQSDERYHLTGVVGPDEFHTAYPGAAQPGVDDNAYTNIMAVWCLQRALELVERLPKALRLPLLEQLGITPADLTHWAVLTNHMFVPFQRDGVVIDQFVGFEQLEPFPWERYRARYGDVHRLDNILEAEGDSVNRYQVCKQADVLMLFYLLSQAELASLLGRLGYRFEEAALGCNVEYYMQRSSRGSTLSRVVQAWVLTRLDRERSWSALTEALGSDLHDVHGGSTREGIHLGAMAGTIDVFQRAYVGLEIRDDRLVMSPRLPPELPELCLRLRYRMQWLQLRVTRCSLHIASDERGEGTITIEAEGRPYILQPGSEHTITYGA